MCVKTYLNQGLITISVGVVVSIAFSLIQWLAVPAITNDILKKFMTLKDGEFVWNIWQDPPFPIYTDYYVFNCTNYQEVVQDGAVPIVKELGPYSFREYRFKNVTDNNIASVDYQEHRLYYFSPETSGSNKLEDVIVTVNPVYMTISKLLLNLPDNLLANAVINPIIRTINEFLREKSESVFMTVPVGQLLYDGWPLDNYIELYHTLLDSLNSVPGVSLPPLPEDFTSFSFGFFTNRNNSDDGLFRVDTGIDDYRKFAQILAWEGSSFLSHWEGGDSYCNAVQGTDGTVFPYDLDTSQRVYIYQTDLCRSVYAVYDSAQVSHGLPGRKFILPRSVLANPAEAPENTCFCQDPSDINSCYGTGLINLGACYLGAPLVGSAPHFFDSDQRYFNTVIGLDPRREEHQTYLLLEQRTNVLLHASKRVQLSIDTQNYRRSQNVGLTDTANLIGSIIPVVWYHERADIDDESAAVFNIFLIIDIVLGVLIGIGGVLVIVGSVLITCHYRKEDKILRV